MHVHAVIYITIRHKYLQIKCMCVHAVRITLIHIFIQCTRHNDFKQDHQCTNAFQFNCCFQGNDYGCCAEGPGEINHKGSVFSFRLGGTFLNQSHDLQGGRLEAANLLL